MNSQTFSIDKKMIGEGHPCYIIAEISCNHEGSLDEALRIVDAAAACGADAVKLQTYTPDTITRDFGQRAKGTMWESIDLYRLYQKAYTPWEWHSPLLARAREKGLSLFSSPFDETAVDFLMNQNVPAFKIASFEVVDTKLLRKVARTGRPVLISSGMTNYLELLEATSTLRQNGCQELAIFQCNSGYPSSFDDANLNTICAMKKLFKVPVGLSDHILFSEINNFDSVQAHVSPLEAVRLGAKLIEVHLTLDREKARLLHQRNEGGFDWAFSRTPEELRKLVEVIRHFEATGETRFETETERNCAHRARGTVSFEPTDKELASRKLRPSLWVTQTVEKGAKLKFAAGSKEGNFDSLRPSGGLEIRYTDLADGAIATRNLEPGYPLSWSDFQLGGT